MSDHELQGLRNITGPVGEPDELRRLPRLLCRLLTGHRLHHRRLARTEVATTDGPWWVEAEMRCQCRRHHHFEGYPSQDVYGQAPGRTRYSGQDD